MQYILEQIIAVSMAILGNPLFNWSAPCLEQDTLDGTT